MYGCRGLQYAEYSFKCQKVPVARGGSSEESSRRTSKMMAGVQVCMAASSDERMLMFRQTTGPASTSKAADYLSTCGWQLRLALNLEKARC